MFRNAAALFVRNDATKDDIIRAGENAIVCLYNGQQGDNLDELVLRTFYKKTSSKTSAVQPETLPPTSAAAKYHSLRVFLQVRQWKDDVPNLPAVQWEWQIVDDNMIPVLTDCAPAPLSILAVIKCKC